MCRESEFDSCSISECVSFVSTESKKGIISSHNLLSHTLPHTNPNTAETSITVSDVTHVVDAGYVKEMRFDPAGGISSLQEVFVSRAAAMQRAGVCYVCLFVCVLKKTLCLFDIVCT